MKPRNRSAAARGGHRAGCAGRPGERGRSGAVAQFAEFADNAWLIAQSVGRAREHGIPAEQIMIWLEEHA